MFDSLYPLEIPADTGTDVLIATYVDNDQNPDAIAQAKSRFPNHQLVTISSHALKPAMILDVERGAVDPTDRATIVKGGYPLIYANTSTWPGVSAFFGPTTRPLWWEANWNGRPSISVGSVGHQYGGVSQSGPPKISYDVSVMIGFIPGLDEESDNMSDMTPAQFSALLTNTDVLAEAYGNAKHSIMDLLQAAAYAQSANAQLTALRATLNPATLAAAISKALPAGSAIPLAELEQAITEVLGSLS